MFQLSKELKEEIQGYYDAYKKHQIGGSQQERERAFLHIPKYENNYLAWVYAGAAILILVLGIRGIGVLPEWVPGILKDANNKLSTIIIIIALLLECSLILTLARLMYYKPEDIHDLFKEYLGAEINAEYTNNDIEGITQAILRLTSDKRLSNQDEPEQKGHLVLNEIEFRKRETILKMFESCYKLNDHSLEK